MKIKSKSSCEWDLVSLGEVMLRLDPGDNRISTTRHFQVWEGGGEYNVARGLRRALDGRRGHDVCHNPVGRLTEDFILQVACEHHSTFRWVPTMAWAERSAMGLNFTERGFGIGQRSAALTADIPLFRSSSRAKWTGNRSSPKKERDGFTVEEFFALCRRLLHSSRKKPWKLHAHRVRLFPTI